MDKEQLREQLHKRLLAIPPDERIEKSRRACKNLISTPQFQSATSIMIYLPLPHEVDTSEAILHAWQLGKSVSVPKISWQQRRMIAVEINSLETGLSTSSLGLRSPATGAPVPFEEIDLVVTPGIGFDKEGHRLGRGNAYYDRFFADEKFRASKCGFAFDEQVIDPIPVDSNDVRMDLLVTNEEILYFND